MNFVGKLDANGDATATLNLIPFPEYVGFKMYFAAALYSPYSAVTNPIDITLV